MRRREFITLVSSAAAILPIAVHAQQLAVPMIGFLRPSRADEAGHLVAAVRQGLRESGYPNEKILIEARWANGQTERLPKLAAELVALDVAAIVANVDAARAAKAATTNIPIVFVTGADPVAAGLVSSVNRPGGNVTGISFYDIPVTAKRLALLRELVPKAEIMAVLQDANFSILQAESEEIQTAARQLGQKIVNFKAATEEQIEAAFSAIMKSGAGALFVGAGQFFNSRRNQLVGLAALNAIPASYALTGIVASGGLMSYGASQTDAYRRAGIYVARILKGDKAAELPVEFPGQVRIVDQPEDRQSTRTYRSRFAGFPR